MPCQARRVAERWPPPLPEALPTPGAMAARRSGSNWFSRFLLFICLLFIGLLCVGLSFGASPPPPFPLWNFLATVKHTFVSWFTEKMAALLESLVLCIVVGVHSQLIIGRFIESEVIAICNCCVASSCVRDFTCPW